MEQDKNYICGPETPLREALGRINSTEHLFQVVLDSTGKVLGTVTDGDIRRGLLNNLTLEDAVEKCMFVDFKYGLADDPAGVQDRLLDRQWPVKFLPVLDGEGRLARLERRPIAAPGSGIARALVMAGGFGTRLGELTRTTPKPLLAVGGEPILGRILTALERAQIPEILVSVHYLADQIEQFVSGRDNRANISLIRESAPLGTAGALGSLPADLKSPTLVINGDVLTQVDYEALGAFHQRHEMDGTIGISPYEIEVPFGVVRVGDDGHFAGLDEKPRISEFISAGIYLLSPQVLALCTPDTRLDMPELLNRARAIGLNFGLFPIHEYWIDVGRADDLSKAMKDHQTS